MAVKGGRKAYDSFARERVLEKLESLWVRFPSLSKDRTAGEISDFRGHDFDRKNFQRLKSGPISDSRVNDIVKWITARHDPTFEETLNADVAFFSNPASSRYVAFSQQEWLAVDREEAKALVARWHVNGLPSGYLDQCAMRYRAVSFMRNTRILRIEPLRLRSSFSPPIHVLHVGDRYLAVSGQENALARNGLSQAIDLNQYTVLDYVRFHFEVVDAERGFHFISSKSDLLYYLLDAFDLSFEAAAALIDADYHALIEAPMIERDATPGHFRVRLDCIASKSYRRLFLSVEPDGAVRIDREVPVRRIAFDGDKDVSQPRHSDPVLIDIAHPVALDEVFALLETTATGSGLLKSVRWGNIAFSAVYGGANNFEYDADSRTVIRTINGLTPVGLGYEAMSLGQALRLADQHLLGMNLPDPHKDIMGYATVAHGKNLDALIWMCRLAGELEASADRHREALSYLEDRNLLTLYNGVRSAANVEELFDIYANN